MPYVQKIVTDHCRNIDHLEIDLTPPEGSAIPFRHLIVTGPNGSGKTGLLESFVSTLEEEQRGGEVSVLVSRIAMFEKAGQLGRLTGDQKQRLENDQALLRRRTSTFFWNISELPLLLEKLREPGIYAYRPAARQLGVVSPDAIREWQVRVSDLRSEGRFAPRIDEYLVYLECQAAFAARRGNRSDTLEIEQQIKQVLDPIRRLFEDPGMKIEFDAPRLRYRFTRSDGHTFDFSTLAAGHAAALDLVAELLLRTEVIQRDKGVPTYQPEGVVIVDEVDAHLHLSLQEQILPMLTRIVPKVQFLVATHSPAVIASIPNAVVVDLKSRKQRLSDEFQGVRYGAIMESHFGLEDDFDAETSQLLRTFYALAKEDHRTADEEKSLEEQASKLSRRSRTLAVEVWRVTQGLSSSRAQVAK